VTSVAPMARPDAGATGADADPGPADSAMAGEVVLAMRGITKSFPGVRALRGVELTVHAGEVAALLGENGAGKSTLMNVLAGVHAEYGGTIEVAGQPVSIHAPRDAQRHGIAMIHQELNLVPELSIADNLFLGRELRTARRTLDRRAMDAKAAALLAEVGLPLHPRRQVRRCRIAEHQLIEVAKALLDRDLRILVMDEPTSALADAEVRRLFEVIRRLAGGGVAIIYISHRLEELAEIADSVTVLRDGAFIARRAMRETTRAELIQMMVGRPLGELFPRERAVTAQSAESQKFAGDQPPPSSGGQPQNQSSGGPSEVRKGSARMGITPATGAESVRHPADTGERDGPGERLGRTEPTEPVERLRVEGLTLRPESGRGRNPVREVSFAVRAGEIVGLAGLMGAGRSEVLEALYGAHPRHTVSGTITLDGRPYRPRGPAHAIGRGLALVAEDRKEQSLVLGHSVRFNASLAALGRYRRRLRRTVDERRERAAVAGKIRELRVKTPGLGTLVGNLSGGNQQKVVLAKCLLTEPKVLLMDEPTRGIDVGAKAEIHALMSRLAARGTAILMVSSELPELIAMCDRILVLCEGRLTGEFHRDTGEAGRPGPAATQEAILAAAMDREVVTQ
jgi:ribose transport system ATP-binding protein